ncbi:MAG: glycosyltransferase, partial [Acidobacteria bacterium]|nr:glycosyltransferase [Acidobacteriota bacterium]
MRIAIDARKLHDFGIGTYIRNILAELPRLDVSNEFVVLCRPNERDLTTGLGANFRTITEPAKPYSVTEQVAIPLALARERVQLLHEPHYVLPLLTRCRSVVTIHDCIHLMFPQHLPNRLAYSYAQASMWVATRKARRILTVSEASKRDLLRFFDVPAERITVIPNAIDERFLVPPNDEQVERVRQRYQ